MKLGTLVALAPALALGAVVLVPPPVAEADHHRPSERGRRSGDERSYRGRDGSQPASRHHRGYRKGDARGRHRGHRYAPRGRDAYGRYPHSSYRHSYRPYDPRGVYRSPPPVVYAPPPGYYARPPGYYAPPPGYYAPPRSGYAPYRRYRGGVHGGVSIGLPFLGFGLYF